MKIKAIALASILALTCVLSSGCLLLAVGAGSAGGVAYAKGDLESTTDASVAKTYDAALKAMDELKLTPIMKSQDNLAAEIVARTATDKKVTVKLTYETEKLTHVSIRIGVFGDEALSRAIYDKVKENLK